MNINAGTANLTANELALDQGSAQHWLALVGGKVSTFSGLSSTRPSLKVGSSQDEFTEVEFSAPPADLSQAAAQLQEAVRSITGLKKALLINDGDRLIALSGRPSSVLVFGPSKQDGTTIMELALESDRPAIAASDGGDLPGPELHVERTTILGKVNVKNLVLASYVIFRDTVIVDQKQVGCVRFSYVPVGSVTPQRFECLPKTSLEDKTPVFTSIRYGDAGYCQLSQWCPEEIRMGDGSAEIGAFHDLYQPQRETNLRVRLNEYLRFSLEAGIFYAT